MYFNLAISIHITAIGGTTGLPAFNTGLASTALYLVRVASLAAVDVRLVGGFLTEPATLTR
jgi:hypothetical protein